MVLKKGVFEVALLPVHHTNVIIGGRHERASVRRKHFGAGIWKRSAGTRVLPEACGRTPVPALPECLFVHLVDVRKT